MTLSATAVTRLKMSRISRRDSLFIGTWASWLLANEPLSALAGTGASDAGEATFGRAKRCVLVWLDGGPSHLEMFDPKPDAPAEVRGPLRSIATKLSGISFGEGLPLLAARADRLLVVRSMTSPVGEHNLATQYALSGHIPGGRSPAPAFMLPVSQQLAAPHPFPRHIAVPDFRLGGGAELRGSHAAEQLPWSLGHDANSPNLSSLVMPSATIDAARLQRRRQLLDVQASTQGRVPDASVSQLQHAIDLLTDRSVREALDMQREKPETRQRYGDKPVGQNCLLARRLIECGVPLVTVNNVGWDTHERLHERLHAGFAGAKQPVGLIPALDRALAALLDDLSSSGLIDETLVVVMGEFGRTPKINPQGGRDHWARSYSVLLAGAGLKLGYCHGKSDKTGESVVDNPVTPAELVATLYHLLGVDPRLPVLTPDGQQMRRVAVGAEPVTQLLA